jgi:hypothetical protein
MNVIADLPGINEHGLTDGFIYDAPNGMQYMVQGGQWLAMNPDHHTPPEVTVTRGTFATFNANGGAGGGQWRAERIDTPVQFFDEAARLAPREARALQDAMRTQPNPTVAPFDDDDLDELDAVLDEWEDDTTL